MSDIKHTPGPWSIHPYSNENPFVVSPEGKPSWAAMDIGIGSGETLIGLVQMCTSNDAGYPHVSIESECKANARLIAAAPELLDVAIRLVSEGLSMGLVKQANLVIAKAVSK